MFPSGRDYDNRKYNRCVTRELFHALKFKFCRKFSDSVRNNVVDCFILGRSKISIVSALVHTKKDEQFEYCLHVSVIPGLTLLAC